MALDFPNSPSEGDTHIASNNILYVFDATEDRWNIRTGSASGLQKLWARDGSTGETFNIYYGESLEIKESGGTTAIDIDPAVGITISSGLKFNGNIDVDGLADLPYNETNFPT